MPLIHGVGQGSVTSGHGLMAGGTWSRDGWEISALGTALRDVDDHLTRGRLLEFSLVKHTQGGWRWGLEKQPFQWGYGLFGGYLVGDAHDPVPRLVLESPSVDLHLFGVPLGSWGFETFLGRLEWDRQVPAWISNPGTVQQSLEAHGDIRRPNFSGLRLKAAFGPNVDMNFGVVSRWGGVDAQGRNILNGLSWWNYPLGYLGAENILVAETTGNAQNPDPSQRFTPPSSYHNISNAVANVELRIRFPETAARWFGAHGMAIHLSRGANNVNWQWRDFLRHPFSAWSHDLSFAARKLGNGRLAGSSPDSLWGWAYAEATPSLVHINDTIGVQWVFDHWDLGFELSDLHNQPYPASTFRTYGNGRFLSGHSRYGDSLGQPLGGEVYSQGVSVGLRLPGQGRMRLQVLDAIRFDRDSPETTSNFTPGEDDHFYHVQLEAQWTLSLGRFGGSFAFEQHQADLFIPGNRRSNWILSLGYAVRVMNRP
ncbi:capsule assembly Wzi family protein [Geothrix terrae]|uniref:capsule assembly Wzi family protein n=1 Tax=Geothrix terrae TaxID=2922720 RepID=UPI001FABC5F4|nr:capsule assembly Wzi family protein [Geothrix terrae]